MSTRFVLQALGQSDYGLYNVVGGIVTILNVFSTAMSTTTRRFINVEMGKQNRDLNKIFNICRNLNGAFAALVFLLAETVGLFYIYNFLNVDPEKFQDAVIVFEISTLVAALGVINVSYQSLIAAYERFSVVALIDITVHIIKLLSVIILLYSDFGNKLVCYAILMCAITLIGLVAYRGYCQKFWPDVVAHHRYKDKKIYKEILVFNNYTALGASTYVARAQGSNMIINYFFGTLINGAFSIAYMFENYSMMIVSNLTTAAAPQIAKSYSSGDRERAFYLTCKINRYSILFMLGITSLLLIELDFVLKTWLDTVPIGAKSFCIWTLISAFSRSLGEGIPPYTQASGRIKWFSIISGLAELLVLPVSIYFFYIGRPPETILIAYVFFTLLYKGVSFFLLHRILNFDVKSFLNKSYVPALKSLIWVTIFFATYKAFWPKTIPWRITGLLVTGLFIAGVIFFVGLTNGEREKCVMAIKRKIIANR